MASASALSSIGPGAFASAGAGASAPAAGGDSSGGSAAGATGSLGVAGSFSTTIIAGATAMNSSISSLVENSGGDPERRSEAELRCSLLRVTVPAASRVRARMGLASGAAFGGPPGLLSARSPPAGPR